MYPYNLTVPESFHPRLEHEYYPASLPAKTFPHDPPSPPRSKVPHTITMVRPRCFSRSFSAYSLPLISLQVPLFFLLRLLNVHTETSSIIPTQAPIFSGRFLPLPRNTSTRVVNSQGVSMAGKECRMSSRPQRRRSISTR